MARLRRVAHRHLRASLPSPQEAALEPPCHDLTIASCSRHERRLLLRVLLRSGYPSSAVQNKGNMSLLRIAGVCGLTCCIVSGTAGMPELDTFSFTCTDVSWEAGMAHREDEHRADLAIPASD